MSALVNHLGARGSGSRGSRGRRAARGVAWQVPLTGPGLLGIQPRGGLWGQVKPGLSARSVLHTFASVTDATRRGRRGQVRAPHRSGTEEEEELDVAPAFHFQQLHGQESPVPSWHGPGGGVETGREEVRRLLRGQGGRESAPDLEARAPSAVRRPSCPRALTPGVLTPDLTCAASDVPALSSLCPEPY